MMKVYVQYSHSYSGVKVNPKWCAGTVRESGNQGDKPLLRAEAQTVREVRDLIADRAAANGWMVVES